MYTDTLGSSWVDDKIQKQPWDERGGGGAVAGGGGFKRECFGSRPNYLHGFHAYGLQSVASGTAAAQQA